MSVGMGFAAIALGYRLERMRPREVTAEGRAVPEQGSDPVFHELRSIIHNDAE